MYRLWIRLKFPPKIEFVSDFKKHHNSGSCDYVSNL